MRVLFSMSRSVINSPNSVGVIFSPVVVKILRSSAAGIKPERLGSNTLNAAAISFSTSLKLVLVGAFFVVFVVGLFRGTSGLEIFTILVGAVFVGVVEAVLGTGDFGVTEAGFGVTEVDFGVTDVGLAEGVAVFGLE